MDDDIEYFALHQGMTVYHGTRSDFDEEVESLDAPFWVSDSPQVAREFIMWNEGDGSPRIITYQTTRPLKLVLINDRYDFQKLEDSFSIDIYSSGEMAAGVCGLGTDGWIIPNNYPSGADIMLCSFDLEYLRTEII